MLDWLLASWSLHSSVIYKQTYFVTSVCSLYSSVKKKKYYFKIPSHSKSSEATKLAKHTSNKTWNDLFLYVILLFSIEQVFRRELQTKTFDKYIIIRILIHRRDNKCSYLKEWQIMGQKFWQIYINNRSEQQNFFIFIWIFQLKENMLMMIPAFVNCPLCMFTLTHTSTQAPEAI